MNNGPGRGFQCGAFQLEWRPGKRRTLNFDWINTTIIPAMAQYVYSMNGVGKIVPPKRHILKDINLSLLPRRQDRRAGPERRRQIDIVKDHGRY